jgi:hypothetical protein
MVTVPWHDFAKPIILQVVESTQLASVSVRKSEDTANAPPQGGTPILGAFLLPAGPGWSCLISLCARET